MRSAAVEEARRIIQAANEKTEAAARKAIELDPRSALAYSALAGLAKWTEAEDLYRQALALDPSDPDIPYSYSVFFRAIGRAKESLRASEQARELEPFVPAFIPSQQVRL